MLCCERKGYADIGFVELNMDWTTPLRSQQSDFIQRLKSGSLLHSETEGQHGELTIVSDERLNQLIDFCWEMAEKYKRNNPVRKVFISNMKGKLGEEVVKTRLANFVTEVDYEKRLGGDGKVDFTLTSNPSVGIQVKTRYGSSDKVKWQISPEEVKKNAVLVCIFSQEEFDDRQPRYSLILAGFLATNMIKAGQTSFGIADLLYAGGLRNYLESLNFDEQEQLPKQPQLYSQERLQSYGLPLCRTYEEIAWIMGISVNELQFLAFSNQRANKSHYIRFKIPKKMGGERLISAPKPRLEWPQRRILYNILNKLEPHNAAHGFCRGRSIVTNAQPHVGAEVIINIDLKDFFPSISYKRVKGLFKSFGYSEKASTVFSLLCTEPEVKEIEQQEHKTYAERYLPQGAPTSPAISNLLCRRLDQRLSQMAEKFCFRYTRYADDITFSASCDNVRHVGNVLRCTESVVVSEGFAIHEQKTRILWKSRQQEVTGVIVNSKPNISRKTLKRLRATLYQIEKDGMAGKRWGESQANLLHSLQGFVNFVSMINLEKGAEFHEQIRRIRHKWCDF